MEKILQIETHEEEIGWSDMEGYAITTDKQTIKLLINSGQCCCENYGYFMSEDNLEEFIGAELLDIKVTDTSRNVTKLKELDLEDMYGGDIMFVDLITSDGTLQFAAYNEHNGYYGHEAKVISQQLNHSEYL
ncbi:DUF7448 domain-containing protein [Bacillus wiedmannii]|uniref:DUF7448 domain-containing protein n=1 Tax=Bacillus wiedmannii TaxID=1890302 RepID=UPI000BF1130A|nr:hypothetical protein [Bacillus wiedmannii]PEO36747.1 hypothetical protein CN555_21330 [Bacillus wiedmannii]